MTDNVDNSPGPPDFEMNQFGGGGGGGGPSKGGDDDDADTLLLEETTTTETKTQRQKSASESATSDLTSGGRSGNTDLASDCSQRSVGGGVRIQADLASTCSGYVSMFRADSGGSAGSNYTQFGLPASSGPMPARASSTPVPNPQLHLLPASSSSQYSSTSLPRPSSNPSPIYRQSIPTSVVGLSYQTTPEAVGLGAMVEETGLGEAGSPGYSLVTGQHRVAICFIIHKKSLLLLLLLLIQKGHLKND